MHALHLEHVGVPSCKHRLKGVYVAVELCTASEVSGATETCRASGKHVRAVDVCMSRGQGSGWKHI